MKKLIFIFVFCLFLISPLVTFADNYSDGMIALSKGNNEEAVKILLVAAEKGDKFSQHCLGVMLYKGQGIKQSYKESFKWWSLAAKQGLAQAKLDLGIMVYHKKVPKNYTDSYK